LKLVNQTEGNKLPSANQFGTGKFDLMKHKKHAREYSSNLYLICIRLLLLAFYYAASKLSFTTTELGDDGYLYPLLVLLVVHNSVYTMRVWDAWILSNSLSAVLNNAVQGLALNDFQDKMNRMFKDKEIYYDIFDIKTLTLTSSSRELIMHYNKSKWKIVTDLTSFYLRTGILLLLIWALVFDMQSPNFSLLTFLINPFSVLISIDLLLMLSKLNATIDHTARINMIPAQQQKFFREYKVLINDLISYYEGKSQLHSDLYKEIAQYLENKFGDKLIQNLYSLKFNVKLLLRDSLENSQMIPAIFGMPLTRAAIYQVYFIMFFQLSGMIGSASSKYGQGGPNGPWGPNNNNNSSNGSNLTSGITNITEGVVYLANIAITGRP